MRAVPMDRPITFADVEVSPSTVYRLRQLQERWFQGDISESDLLMAVDQLGTD